MRERISMKSKMLGALALFTLIGALFIMQSAGNSPPTVDAATGTIAVLNVGTCLTTDADVFDGDCATLAGPGTQMGDQRPVPWEVREEVTEVSDLYATYAYDPKTASDEPRVILEDSDLIKISIADSGRDKRTGVLIKGDDDSDSIDGAMIGLRLVDGQLEKANADDAVAPTETGFVRYEANTVSLTVQGGQGSKIENSGNWTLNINDTAANATYKPMDVGGTIRFFGCLTDASDCVDTDIKDITSSLEVDEDGSEGQADGTTNIAPWVSVNASVPETNVVNKIVITAIYYETSDKENLVGGHGYYYCRDLTHTLNEDDDVWTCDNPTTDMVEVADALTQNEPVDVVYTEDEIDDNDALVVRAKSDGDEQSVNLYLV